MSIAATHTAAVDEPVEIYIETDDVFLAFPSENAAEAYLDGVAVEPTSTRPGPGTAAEREALYASVGMNRIAAD